MANMYKVWFVGLMFLLIGVFATASAQAYIIDGTIFDDEFNGVALDPTNWASYTAGTGSAAVAGGMVTVHTDHPGTNAKRVYNPSDLLDYSNSPDDWWVEMRFKMVGYLDDSNESATSPRSWLVLAGESGGFNVRGFDLRALEHTNEAHTETVFDLGWYGNDNTAGTGTTRVATNIHQNLNKDQFYVINLHRKPDGNVDIFLDDSLIATKPLINNINPLRLMFGDAATTQVGGTEVLDYVRVGELVPEPSSLAILAMAGLGLLCYAWKKRK